MKIKKDFVWKLGDDLRPGELVRYRYGDKSALGIAIARDQTGYTEFAFLTAPAEGRGVPFRDRFDAEGEHFLSYGLDWELELIDPGDLFSEGTDHSRTPGVIHVAADTCLLRVARPPRDMQSQPGNLNLGTMTFSTSIPSGAVGILHWKLWANSAHTARRDAVPLFEFNAPAESEIVR